MKTISNPAGLSSLLALTLLVSGFARSAPRSPLSTTDVIAANLASTSYADWMLSGQTPEALFDTTRARGAVGELCQPLLELDASALMIFDEQIEAAPPGELPCRARLLPKLEAYWAASQSEVDAELSRMREANDRSFSLERALRTGNPFAPSLLLESITRAIPAADIGKFHTAATIREQFAPGEIAITLDDGPHPSHTRTILDTLASYGVRATYFEVGEMIHSYPNASKLAADAGHSMGSHTWTHPIAKTRNLSNMSATAVEREIFSAVDEVERVTGQMTKFFRFPGGIQNARLLSLVEGRGITAFHWNMDEIDYKVGSTGMDVYRRAVGELNREGKGIILCHDIHKQTAQAMPMFLEELRRRGLKTVVYVPAQPGGLQ